MNQGPFVSPFTESQLSMKSQKRFIQIHTDNHRLAGPESIGVDTESLLSKSVTHIGVLPISSYVSPI